MATAIGSVLGGVGLWVLGGYLGDLYAGPPETGEIISVPALIGALGGYWLGACTGAWVGLRVRSYPARRATAALVGLLSPLPVAAVIFIGSVIGDYMEVPQMVPQIGGLLVLAGIGPLARALVLRGLKVNIRSYTPTVSQSEGEARERFRREVALVSGEFALAAQHALEAALTARVARLVQSETSHFDRLGPEATAAFREAAAEAIARTAREIGERLRDSELWENPTVRLAYREEAGPRGGTGGTSCGIGLDQGLARA